MPQPRGMCAPRHADGAVITTGVFTADPGWPVPGTGMADSAPLAIPYVRFRSAEMLAALRRQSTIIRNRVR